MYTVIEGNSHGLADVDSFLDLISLPHPSLRGLFDPARSIFVTRAPGRLDVMGGIADYSGSLVLELPIAEATFAAVQPTDDRTIRIVSLHGRSDRSSNFEMPVELLESIRDYGSVRNMFSREHSGHWASYAAGVFFVLRRELDAKFTGGARIAISSNIPIGKGVSSSAALEVAVMQAVCAAFDIAIEPRRLAMLCQTVENKIVGAACGVMDQITVACGTKDALISMLCQPAEIGDPVAIPEAIEFWGIDSGVRHAVAGSDYASVRLGAFMGYRVIADVAGLPVETVGPGLVKIEDARWRGHLANISTAEFVNEFSAAVPTSIVGSEFLERFGGTTDPITTIDPARTYAVRAPTEHAIYESARVRAFADLLNDDLTDTDLELLGELMFGSHASYKACGLTERWTDRIVELVRERQTRGLFGARITGGGSGGTVVVLARRGSRSQIIKLAKKFRAESRCRPYIFHGSSPGCAAFGHLKLAFAK